MTPIDRGEMNSYIYVLIWTKLSKLSSIENLVQSSVDLVRSSILNHHINDVEYQSDAGPTKHTPYLALTGDLWDVLCEYFFRKLTAL